MPNPIAFQEQNKKKQKNKTNIQTILETIAKILPIFPLLKSVSCVPPYKLPLVMRIPMPNPVGGEEKT